MSWKPTVYPSAFGTKVPPRLSPSSSPTQIWLCRRFGHWLRVGGRKERNCAVCSTGLGALHVCRRCHRLRYCSQRETKEDRATRAMLKIVRRLLRQAARPHRRQRRQHRHRRGREPLCPRAGRAEAGYAWVRTILAVPLMYAGEVISTITLRRSEARQFSYRQIDLE